jgi:hypothetical protein
MSWMIALSGSRGSSTPSASPVSTSYWPALPKDAQVGGVPVQNAGEVVFRIVIRVTRASAGGDQAIRSSGASNERAGTKANGVRRIDGIDRPPPVRE